MGKSIVLLAGEFMPEQARKWESVVFKRYVRWSSKRRLCT
jgi:hypothetical protein